VAGGESQEASLALGAALATRTGKGSELLLVATAASRVNLLHV
jgi:hypothetical protein